MPKITIGVPTYNRLNLLKIMSNSLYNSDLSISPNIRIYDDCSTELTKETLETIFPDAKTIKINSSNLKADKNIYQMYVDFLTTDDDYFFNADSDLIFNKHWLNLSLEYIKKTDGVLTIFNTIAHKPSSIVDDLFCLKDTIGSAGTLFKRDCIENMVNYFHSINMVKGFDWQWSKYFCDNNIKIYCLNNSLVQHIGYSGQHSLFYFDVGKGFKIETINDGQIMNDILVDCIDSYKQKDYEIKKKLDLQNNSFLYNLSNCFKIVARKILPNFIKRKIKNIIKRK